MSADRYEIFDEGSQIRILYSGSISTIISGPLGTHIEDAVIGAIRQQARDLDQLRAECDILTHKVICCGVAAWHSDPLLTTTGAYAGKWNSPQADCVRKLRAERDQLRADLAAAVADRERIRAMYVESTERLCDDLQTLRHRAEQAEARLAALDSTPAVAHIANKIGPDYFPCGLTILADRKLPPLGTDLIARPAKD